MDSTPTISQSRSETETYPRLRNTQCEGFVSELSKTFSRTECECKERGSYKAGLPSSSVASTNPPENEGKIIWEEENAENTV